MQQSTSSCNPPKTNIKDSSKTRNRVRASTALLVQSTTKKLYNSSSQSKGHRKKKRVERGITNRKDVGREKEGWRGKEAKGIHIVSWVYRLKSVQSNGRKESIGQSKLMEASFSSFAYINSPPIG